MQPVHALVRDPVLDALWTRQLYAPCLEERTIVRGVDHLDEARVEVDFGRERRDGDQGGAADREDGSHGLIEEAL